MTALRCIDGGRQGPAVRSKAPTLRVVGDADGAPQPAAPQASGSTDGGAARNAARKVLYVTEGDLRGLALIRVASIDDEYLSKDTANLWRCDGLSDWERNFVRGVREYHARNGQITIKQKRLIDKLCSEHLRKRKRRK